MVGNRGWILRKRFHIICPGPILRSIALFFGSEKWITEVFRGGLGLNRPFVQQAMDGPARRQGGLMVDCLATKIPRDTGRGVLTKPFSSRAQDSAPRTGVALPLS